MPQLTKSTLRAASIAFPGLLTSLLVLSGCTSGTTSTGRDGQRLAGSESTQVMPTAEIQWGALNPARGDNSPRAGTLWGDRTGTGASGILVKFKEGFSSPPHIHNITYRGVVIEGLVHNDDPDAENMWMPAGSFWTQPAGESHITSASARFNTAYIEIDSGPYLVLPAAEAFDSSVKPINVEESNIVWIDASSLNWIDLPGAADPSHAPKVAFLWGDPQDADPNGSLVKLPANFAGTISSRSGMRVVVIQGQTTHHHSNEPSSQELEPGSYFGSDSGAVHKISTTPDGETTLYIRSAGRFEIRSSSID